MQQMARVLLNHPRFFIADYVFSTPIKVGYFVLCPVRKKIYKGIVIELIDSSRYKLVEGNGTVYKTTENYVKFLHEASNFNLVALSSLSNIFSNLGKRIIPIIQHVKSHNITLSENQEAVKKDIVSCEKPTLIYGITGSGKTEVFFSTIYEYIKKGGQALILLPEISLTEAVLDRFEKAFSIRPVVWTSASKNKTIFSSILLGSAKIVVGTRSAIFLPFRRLKVIVVDEEHDSSYKQMEKPIYNARTMAVMRGNTEGIKVILVSATPSIESMYFAYKGQYQLVELKERFNKRPLPKVTIIPTIDLLSPYFLQRAQEEISKQGQVIVFLNRRGYSYYVICKSCSNRILCEKCEGGMIYHKEKKKFCCHNCSLEIEADKCLNCGGKNLLYYGIGVEKIKEEIDKKLKANVAIFSSDTHKDSEDVQAFFKAIKNKEIDLIIGTQMIVKGHDFPDISLILIVNLEPKGIDYKAAENIIQTVLQVAGRAGRGEKDAEIIIQMKAKRENYIIESIRKNDYDLFVHQELGEREKWNLPPFYRMLVVKSSKKESIEKICQKFETNIVHYTERKKNFWSTYIKISKENYMKKNREIKEYLLSLNVITDVE
jgi:primosomal protein N' (replication factor Y)